MAKIHNFKRPLFQKYKAQICLLLVFLLLFVIYHLATLTISPIPWFDETFFASLTASFNSTKNLNLGIAPYAYKGEILMYGPIYFWITSLSTKALGFDIFSFRLPALIFGILCLLVYYKILRLFLSWVLSLVVVIAFALDPLLNTHMHAGRMESLTLFFALISIFLVLKVNTSSYSVSKALFLFAIAGLMFSLALLTTPRVGVLLLALMITQIYYLFKTKSIERFYQLIIFGSTLLTVYLIWFFLAFKNLANFVAYYSDLTQYFGGELQFPKQQIPLIITAVSVFIIGLIKYRKQYFSELVNLSFAAIILFYIIVQDMGPYSLLILPFYYAIIGSSVSCILPLVPISQYKMLLTMSPLLVVILFNFVFFFIKLFTVLITRNARDPKPITAFVQRNIPPMSKVIGDDIFYYAVVSAKSDFQYIHIFKVDSVREYYHRQIYDYDYIVMSPELDRARPHLLPLYQKNSKLIKVGEYIHNGKKSIPFVENLSSLFQVKVRSTYDCTIYKRLKKPY